MGVWLRGFKILHHYQLAHSLSCAFKSDVRSQLLVCHHVCISTAMFAIVMIIDSNPLEL